MTPDAPPQSTGLDGRGDGAAPAVSDDGASAARAVLQGLGFWLLVLLPVGVAGAITVVLLGGSGYTRIHQEVPGLLTSLLSTSVRAVATTSAVVCAGALVHLLTGRRAGPRRIAGRDPVVDAAELGLLGSASLVLLASACAGVLVDAADGSGISVGALLDPAAGWTLITSSSMPRAWLVVAGAALLTYVLSWLAGRWEDLLLPAGLIAVALLAPVAVGHVLVGPNHDYGSDTAYLLTLASSVVVGLSLVLARRRHAGLVVTELARRRWAVVLVWGSAMSIVGEAGVLWFMAPTGLLASGWTGALAAVRITALVALLGLGLRLRSTPTRSDATFWAAAAASAGYLAAQVAETRIPPPQYFVPTSIQQVYLGFDVPDAPTLSVVLTQWRPNVLFLVIAATACALYLLGVRRLRARGDRWPLARTLPWLFGWAVVTIGLSTGLGRYASASFSLHMLVHMMLTMLGPLLLVLGGPVTLALRATRPAGSGPAGPHEWLVGLTHSRVLHTLWSPLPTFAIFVGSFYLLYLTPLFDLLMRYHYAHQAMNVHFLLSGYLFYGLVIGVDRPPRPLPHLGRLGFVLASMPFHAFFAVAVMSADDVIGSTFYGYIQPVWQDDPLRDQYIGGGIAWAAGEIPLLIVLLVLFASWSRQDAHEAAAADRRADRAERARSSGRTPAPRDDEFDAYNEMLRRLAERDSQRTP